MEIAFAFNGFAVDVENSVAVLIFNNLLKKFDFAASFLKTGVSCLIKCCVLCNEVNKNTDVLNKAAYNFPNVCGTTIQCLSATVLLVTDEIVDELRERQQGHFDGLALVITFWLPRKDTPKITVNLSAECLVRNGLPNRWKVPS